MTAEKVLKLDGIASAMDLKWSDESPNAGHPQCLCSACGEQIHSDEYYEDEPGYEIGACEAHDMNHPVRLWNGKGKDMLEAVLHMECFMWLNEKGTLKFDSDGKLCN